MFSGFSGSARHPGFIHDDHKIFEMKLQDIAGQLEKIRKNEGNWRTSEDIDTCLGHSQMA